LMVRMRIPPQAVTLTQGPVEAPAAIGYCFAAKTP
jgi:hypothetical protein